MKLRSHTDLINYFVKPHHTYLEIGTQRNVNYNVINAKFKIGVDPDPNAKATFCGTSDEYFALPRVPYVDVCFIDGLHHADQVKRDFDNTLNVLKEGGVIIFHDTMPETIELTSVPRAKKGRWLGDVYKFILELNTYSEIDFRTLDFDNGCTVAWRDYSKPGIELEEEPTWEYYTKNKDLMRVATFEQLIEAMAAAQGFISAQEYRVKKAI
jgi:SAM-dependent methyltransferase